MKDLLASLLAVNSPISWRRLAAFGVATALRIDGSIGEDTWMWICIAFIGGEVAGRLASATGAIAPQILTRAEDPAANAAEAG